MKIDIKPKKETVLFDNLKKGETFKYIEEFYMKTMQAKIGSTKLDAVLLRNGDLVVFHTDSEVEKCSLKVVSDES